MENVVDVDRVIEFLNSLVELDQEAIEKLIEARVFCNEALADHPTVQVGTYHSDSKLPKVGMLGILNGMFGADTQRWGYICAVYDVICPNGHDIPQALLKAPGRCPTCDAELSTWKLTKFQRTVPPAVKEKE